MAVSRSQLRIQLNARDAKSADGRSLIACPLSQTSVRISVIIVSHFRISNPLESVTFRVETSGFSVTGID
jgi:hypothetical protein